MKDGTNGRKRLMPPRQSKVKVRPGDEPGQVEILDASTVPFIPTPEQVEFLNVLLDEEGLCRFSLYKSIHKVGGTMRDLNYWCRDPGFVKMLEEAVEKRRDVSFVQADLTAMGAAEGGIEPTKDQWKGVDRLLRIREYIDTRKLRMLTINQQFNIVTPLAGMSMEKLLELANGNAS